MEQWSLYIDIEGFGQTYESGSQALVSLGALMEGIYLLGSRYLVESPDRIFAHQVGDGFIIVGEFGRESLAEPVSIAILLLRQIVLAGGIGKAAISEGQFADVVRCYPKVIQEAQARTFGGAFPLGGGVMSIFPVMGTALINAFKLISSPDVPSGALLVAAASDLSRLPEETRAEPSGAFAVIDWVHSSPPRVAQLAQGAKLRNPNSSIVASLVERYTKGNRVNDEWRDNTLRFLHIKDAT